MGNRLHHQKIRTGSDLKRLTRSSYTSGLKYLRRKDRDLARIIAKHGNPPMWVRRPGFPTLLWIILEQQVSLASARAAFNKLLNASKPLSPSHFLTFNDSVLKRFGFSRQKTAYGRNVARAIISGELRLHKFGQMNTQAIREELMKIKGIGIWTADIYILMALRRQDVWPSGDLALAVGVQKLRRMRNRPSPMQLERMSLKWQPWRSVAARIVWHYYLNNF